MIQDNFTVCGSCRSVMDIRVDEEDLGNESLDKAVRFAYCSTCKRGHKLPRGVLAPNPVFCAICSYQAITVTKPDGKTHAICPQCFKCVTHSLHTHCTALLHYDSLHFICVRFVHNYHAYFLITRCFRLYHPDRNPPGMPHCNDASQDFR